MNSKDRVTACIKRVHTDAVPLGFYLVDHDIISAVIGRPTFVRNNVASAIAFWNGRRDEVVESMKTDLVDFYRAVDICDLIAFKEAYPVPPKNYEQDPPVQIAPDCWQDKDGRVFKLSTISNEFVCVKNPPLEKMQWTLADLEKILPNDPPDPTVFEVYDHLVQELGKDRFIAGCTAGYSMPLIGGMERGLMEYVLNPANVKAAAKQDTDFRNIQDKYYLRNGISGAFIENDMCSTKGPYISPLMWREFCFEGMKSRINNIKQLTGLPIIFHSCGNSRQMLDMWIEAGIDVYQSIQTIPQMCISDLKRDFGRKVVLWGGVPVEELVGGTPQSVRNSVRTAMESGAPGGGFILGPSHSIAYGTKYENFMAMLDEFDKLRYRF